MKEDRQRLIAECDEFMTYVKQRNNIWFELIETYSQDGGKIPEDHFPEAPSEDAPKANQVFHDMHKATSVKIMHQR